MVTPRTVLALLALAFTATHCIDIDDRDLEVSDGDDDENGGSSGSGNQGGNSGTGGGDPTCPPSVSDSDCTLCTKYYCCYEIDYCANSIDCQDFVYCFDACLDDVCLDDCVAEFPDGAAEFDELLACSYENCVDVCG